MAPLQLLGCSRARYIRDRSGRADSFQPGLIQRGLGTVMRLEPASVRNGEDSAPPLDQQRERAESGARELLARGRVPRTLL